MEVICNPKDPIDILARTIWGEARGEPPGGMEAVAAVIANRARNPRWWGHDIISVCRKPHQFSCWNTGDPNLPKMLCVTPDDQAFSQALAIAERAVFGDLPDTTGGADSCADLRFCQPDWATPDKMTVKIGNQTFFKVEL